MFFASIEGKDGIIMSEFDKLQQKLVEMWKMIGSGLHDLNFDERTVIVVPALPDDIELSATWQQAYEERLLFLLFLLRMPSLRLIYITSQPISPEIIDYYLDLMPGVVASSAKRRLFLVAPEDGSAGSLSKKIINRPHLIKHIQSLILDFDKAHIVPFLTTDLERELAVALGVPMYAADPRFFAFGTKSGCRRVFAEEGIRHPLGYEDLYSIDAVVESIAKIHAQRPNVQKVVVKLNEGVSGMGNALVDLSNLPPVGDANEQTAIRQALENMQLELSSGTYENYAQNLEETGAIVEEYIIGVDIQSPSAQLRITPLGDVEMLSTHDQILGGPSGQSYIGAKFPANPDYSWLIMQDAVKIGERFAKEGIVGRFAVDFVVVQKEDGTWESYAIEVNLRKGGTTAPFLILQYLSDGAYHAETGEFFTAQGACKCYVASDHLSSEAYRMFTPNHLFEIVSKHRLHYNHATQTGIVMHIVKGVAELGSVGVTAIANSHDEAQALYTQFKETLDQEAELLLS